MGNNKPKFDGICILKEPIILGENPDEDKVYAFMFDSKFEKQYEGRPFKSIDEYISYHKGIEIWRKKVGPDSISDDFDTFDYGNGICLRGAKSFMNHTLTVLFRGEVEYETIIFDTPIQYEPDEVDACEPRAVVKKSLIDRIKNSVKSDD